MTSSNGNILRVTGHLCREFTGHRRIPRTKASDAQFWCLFYLRLNERFSLHSWRWWFETPSGPLSRHSNDSPSLMNYGVPFLGYFGWKNLKRNCFLLRFDYLIALQNDICYSSSELNWCFNQTMLIAAYCAFFQFDAIEFIVILGMNSDIIKPWHFHMAWTHPSIQ